MQTWISFASFSDELQKLAAKEKVIPLAKAEKKIFNALMQNAPVKVRILPEAAAYGGGYFDQVNKEIGLSEKNYQILAHEIGHAEIDKHLLGRIIQSRAVRLASGAMGNALSGLGAGILMAKGKKWGVLLPTAIALPTLLSEGVASYKGNKLLKEHGATDEQQRDYRNLALKMFGTYAAAPAISTGLAAYMSRR